jgi:S-adenosylmethionine decarboxylase
MSSDDLQGSAPFEGPEKLLEIWFAPSANHVPHHDNIHKTGLRSVDGKIWEKMLSIVQCKVLSVINGQEMDAYLLRSGTPFFKIFLSSCFDPILANLLSLSFLIGSF